MSMEKFLQDLRRRAGITESTPKQVASVDNYKKNIKENNVVQFPGNPNPKHRYGQSAEIRGIPQPVDYDALDSFTKAYIESALWSSTTDDDEPLDRNYDIDDIHHDTIKEMAKDCKQFQFDNAKLLQQAYQNPAYTEANAGHDFWLTRNGHGAGFWDRGLGTVGKLLTDASKGYGEYDLYVGDDGFIYGA